MDAATPAPAAKAQKKTAALVLTISIAIHAAVAIVAGVWIIARYFTPPPAVFIAKKSVVLPPKLLDQKMAAAEYEAASPRPSFDDRMSTLRATDFALPDLPDIPMDQIMPIDPSAVMVESISSLMGAGGSGSGGGGEGSGGFGGGGEGFSFFGIKDAGQSVVIMVDVSGSMFLRLGEDAFEVVKRESLNVIDKLSISQRFGIVIWSGGAGKWQAELVPATDDNRAAAREWIRANLNGEAYKRMRSIAQDVLREGPGGTRHDLALRQAFSLQPEIVFMISDGNALRANEVIPTQELLDLVESLQKTLVQPSRLHSIYFITGPEKEGERDLLRQLAKKNKGTFKEFDAKTQK